MEMIYLASYFIVGILGAVGLMFWTYMDTGFVRGDDLLVGIITILFWPIVIMVAIPPCLERVFSHDRVILRRKK